MKKSVILIMLVLLLIPFCYAASVDIEFTPVKDSVTPLDNAVYDITITNNEDRSMTFEFVYLDIFWKLEPERVTVPAKESSTTQLTLVSQYESKPNIIELIVSSTDKTFRTEKILKLDLVKYPEIVDLDPNNMIIPEPVDPRKGTVITVKLVNTHEVNLDDIKLNLKSQFFEEERTVSLSEFETKSEDFEIELEDSVLEGSYPLVATITFKGRLVGNITKDMVIGAYGGVKEIKSPESGFLYTKIVVTKTNDGNSVIHDIYRKEVSGFEKLFTKSNPAYTSVTKLKDGYYLNWEFELQPGATKTITIETSYRTFTLITILIIIAAILLYYWFKPDIRVNKRVVSLQKRKEDGTTIIKIIVSVKNISLMNLRNVKVLDRIHGSEPEFETMKPKTIKGLDSTKMVWEIPVLHRGEERLFSYRSHSKVSVAWKRIPAALVRYGKGKRQRVAVSNSPKLL